MPGKRKVIVGLDGMPYGLMDRFARDGTMPNFGALVRQGLFRKMASSIPEVSSVAWSSIITGTNPGEHGIFGFTDIAPGTYRMTFPNFGSLCIKPFWEHEGSGRAVILNVPTTFPAREMNGVLVAGFVALDLERATFPPSLVPKLKEMEYRVDVDSQKAHQSLNFFLRDLEETLQARIAAYRYLWHQEEWDTFMLVFTGTDRLAHFLWHAFDDESHEHHQAILEHFQQIDGVIGEIVQDLRDDDSLVMLSDHGFERVKKNVFVNYLLVQEGFLTFQDGATPSLRTISDDTLAFALDPGRIYVNEKGRFPRGGVEPACREIITGELEELFVTLELDGDKVIKHVYRGADLYSGAQTHRAPDLVLLGNSGYNLRGNMKAKQLFGTDLFAGKHSQADAFLLLPESCRVAFVPETVSVSDVWDIVKEL